MQSTNATSVAASNMPTHVYSYTQTINSRYFGTKVSQSQYDITHEHLIDILRSVGVNKIAMVCELTRNSDVHYHGILEVPKQCLDRVRYIINNRIRKCKYFGFRQIDLVHDLPGWHTYIAKDLERTKRLLGRMPIICDDFNMFPEDFMFHYGIKI